MSYKQIDEQFDKEFDDFFLPCPDEVRNELKSFLHQIYSQAKADAYHEIADRIEMWTDDGVIKTTDDIVKRINATVPYILDRKEYKND